MTEPPGRIPSTNLVAARVELHWAAQVVSAVADAYLPKRADDGHTSMRWESPEMIGESAPTGLSIALSVPDLMLRVSDGTSFALVGSTLQQAMMWAAQRFGTASAGGKASVHVRDYDMPTSPLKSGDRFVGHLAELAELVRWYDLGLDALTKLATIASRVTPIRIWPHHFDLGAIIFLDAASDDRQIGIGLSPGDGSYVEPYFYVTPYPLVDTPAYPALPSGTWRREGWTGAVLTGTQIIAGADVHAFLRAAVDGARSVIR